MGIPTIERLLYLSLLGTESESNFPGLSLFTFAKVLPSLKIIQNIFPYQLATYNKPLSSNNVAPKSASRLIHNIFPEYTSKQ